jgi:hypothetical protein
MHSVYADGEFVSASRRANFRGFKSYKVRISPRKNSVRFGDISALKIQHGQIESSPPAPLAIPHEELLPSLQKYCFNKWMVRAFQREPGFEELQAGSEVLASASLIWPGPVISKPKCLLVVIVSMVFNYSLHTFDPMAQDKRQCRWFRLIQKVRDCLKKLLSLFELTPV